MRPIQIWVRDVRSARCADEARRQSGLVTDADAPSADQAFVDAISANWEE
ncbi:MAG: antitoxin MazE family protein [Actinomycetota bacterium]|nr:antitoxin MazE family protein [Actinomycetota bacterium]